MSRFGQVNDGARGFSIQAIKGLASTRFASILDGKIQGGPGRSGTAGGRGSAYGDQENGSLSENCVVPMSELHMNVEFDAKCLSQKKVVFHPARTPHNLPHRLRMLRRAVACLGVMRAAPEL